MKNIKGFTLIELMIVVVIVAAIAAITYPNYRDYVEKKDLKDAQQTALRLSMELERFKNKNFSYKGFNAAHIYPTYNASTGELYLPLGRDAASALYKITIVDEVSKNPLSNTTVLGQNWVMKAERVASGTSLKQPRNFDFLISSTGKRCMTKTVNAVAAFVSCGSDAYEQW
jgi:type IV pilus assembly protein PilE